MGRGNNRPNKLFLPKRNVASELANDAYIAHFDVTAVLSDSTKRKRKRQFFKRFVDHQSEADQMSNNTKKIKVRLVKFSTFLRHFT